MPPGVVEQGTKGPEPVRAGPSTRPDDLSVLLQGERPVDELLRTVVEVAVEVLPGARGASISLAMDTSARRLETAGASSDAVQRLDEIQYVSGAGPCVHAIRSRSEVRAEMPAAEWADFSAAAQEASVAAVWSLPLEVRERVTGAFNLYSTGGSPWGDVAAATVGLLVRQASALLSGAVALAQSEQINDTLRRALETRTVIGQAQGVLMARQGIGPDDAFDILRRASQRTNRKLREVAAEIVEGVSHGRHRPDVTPSPRSDPVTRPGL